MTWRTLTPTERCKAISERLCQEPTKRIPPDPKLSVLARTKARRDILEVERPDWTRLVQECSGSVRQIAKKMGYDRTAARKALWDLGLWPEVVHERQRNMMYAHYPEDKLKRAIEVCDGNVMRIAAVLKVSRQCARRLLIDRGLWDLVEQRRQYRRISRQQRRAA